LDAVAAWLKENKDQRYQASPDGRSGRITDINGACADFCQYMAERTRKQEILVVRAVFVFCLVVAVALLYWTWS
jgi:hypothetical protein